MFPASTSSAVRKTRSRRRKAKSKQSHLVKLTKMNRLTTLNSSVITQFHAILHDLNRPGSRFLSYTIIELEPICQQIAIQQMASTITISDSCPFMCIFCQDLIYQPMTLYCGHTFCEECIKDDQISSSINCPRCPNDIQGQIQSSIVHARERSYRKNRFVMELFEHSETLKIKYKTISLCHQGQVEYDNGNYDKAIEIYTQIIDQHDDEHLAFYHRAKAYKALKEYDQAFSDATRVVTLRSQWAKGYLCQSEILFEMNHSAAALMASLKALKIDPEDQIGKQTMAQHLHAVLHNHNDEESMDAELEKFSVVSHGSIVEASTSESEDLPLTICKATQSKDSCFCFQFDYKNLYLKDFDCSICVNLLWFPVTTPCGHVFCRECLIRSVDNTQILCPICKSSLEDFFPMLIQSHVNSTEIISKIIETYFPLEFSERRELHEQEGIQAALVPQNTTELDVFEISIFVCVLTFPYCGCPLHVFEPRYRLMMRRTVETASRTFGMCTYDEQTRTFVDYGTLLFIRGLVYTQDGRSVVDTIGQRRFRVIERGRRDEYYTAKVQLIRDDPIEQHEFDDLFQMNHDTYKRARHWFDHLDSYRKTIMTRQLEGYPPCDDLTAGSTDGPSWAWIMLNLLPIEELLKYTALASRSFRIRLQMINDTIDFQLNQQQQQAAVSAINE